MDEQDTRAVPDPVRLPPTVLSSFDPSASSALFATLYAASHTATALSSIALAAAASLPTATLAWTALVRTSRVLACVDRFVWTVVWTVV